MSYREQLLALRARCRGSRLKTYQNIYRSAWKSGEVLDDPESVYNRAKNKHLVFAESCEEKEVRVDAEHASLAKGRISASQFEPLFKSSISELESVGYGKTPRDTVPFLPSQDANHIFRRKSEVTRDSGELSIR